ncbi:hypothetical protein M441DRAFT_44078 [Trichoderma asperellum CBS 433.97]|uniref:Uncharacterized protein n=1 Tax=Trichoderma asperellum (strain ATCC 204424 / CBS 433.97 / NBRC 101777) TaxID=1042311 RepID=A0A2T3ZGL9_TRIA4|nr:hypothetical protein M441DRAFT_44078 [Trichoderma asperellum CBS 433.97]PTB43955.1 hypothetical protein M441DRAFT_44078 [Trichoderma asperellum CBS 433.97]
MDLIDDRGSHPSSHPFGPPLLSQLRHGLKTRSVAPGTSLEATTAWGASPPLGPSRLRASSVSTMPTGPRFHCGSVLVTQVFFLLFVLIGCFHCSTPLLTDSCPGLAFWKAKHDADWSIRIHKRNLRGNLPNCPRVTYLRLQYIDSHGPGRAACSLVQSDAETEIPSPLLRWKKLLKEETPAALRP